MNTKTYLYECANARMSEDAKTAFSALDNDVVKLTKCQDIFREYAVELVDELNELDKEDLMRPVVRKAITEQIKNYTDCSKNLQILYFNAIGFERACAEYLNNQLVETIAMDKDSTVEDAMCVTSRDCYAWLSADEFFKGTLSRPERTGAKRMLKCVSYNMQAVLNFQSGGKLVAVELNESDKAYARSHGLVLSDTGKKRGSNSSIKEIASEINAVIKQLMPKTEFDWSAGAAHVEYLKNMTFVATDSANKSAEYRYSSAAAFAGLFRIAYSLYHKLPISVIADEFDKASEKEGLQPSEGDAPTKAEPKPDAENVAPSDVPEKTHKVKGAPAA